MVGLRVYKMDWMKDEKMVVKKELDLVEMMDVVKVVWKVAEMVGERVCCLAVLMVVETVVQLVDEMVVL
eukprot:gene6393-biopygen3039